MFDLEEAPQIINKNPGLNVQDLSYICLNVEDKTVNNRH